MVYHLGIIKIVDLQRVEISIVKAIWVLIYNNWSALSVYVYTLIVCLLIQNNNSKQNINITSERTS